MTRRGCRALGACVRVGAMLALAACREPTAAPSRGPLQAVVLGVVERGASARLVALRGADTLAPASVAWRVSDTTLASITQDSTGAAMLRGRAVGIVRVTVIQGTDTAGRDLTVGLPPRVVFAFRGGSGGADIWSVRLDGTELTNLTPDSPLDDTAPSVGCGQIAFASLRSGGTSAIYAMGYTGGSVTPVFRNVTSPRAAPTADRQCARVAFTAPVGGTDRIFVSDWRDAPPIPGPAAPAAGAIEGDPALSPDGRQLASWNTEQGAPAIVVATFGSSTVQRLASPHSAFAPAWRLDGRRLAVASNRDTTDGGPTSIYEIDLASAQWRRLTTGGASDTDPAYLEDGRLVFVRVRTPTDAELRWIDPTVPGLGGVIPLPAGRPSKPASLP